MFPSLMQEYKSAFLVPSETTDPEAVERLTLRAVGGAARIGAGLREDRA